MEDIKKLRAMTGAGLADVKKALTEAEGDMDKAKEIPVKAELSSQEWQLIQMIRNLEYGQLTITVKGSKPIHVEEVRKSIPLK